MVSEIIYFLFFILLPFCTAFAFIVYIPFQRIKQRFKCTEIVDALIAELRKSEYGDPRAKDTDIIYYPMYKYEFREQTYSNISVVNTVNSSDLGKTVKIRINPQNPKDIYEQQGLAGGLKITASIIFGLLFLGIGLWSCANF